jgi:hypothetical protein
MKFLHNSVWFFQDHKWAYYQYRVFSISTIQRAPYMSLRFWKLILQQLYWPEFPIATQEYGVWFMRGEKSTWLFCGNRFTGLRNSELFQFNTLMQPLPWISVRCGTHYIARSGHTIYWVRAALRLLRDHPATSANSRSRDFAAELPLSPQPQNRFLAANVR